MSASTFKRRWRDRAVTLGTALATAALAVAGAVSVQGVAQAADFPGQVTPGHEVSGVLGTGDVWLGALENPNGDTSWLAWCTQAGLVAPTTATTVTVSTLTGTQANGQPSDLTVTTAQMAWILQNKESIATADSRAAIAYLVHLNYETGNGSLSGAQRVAQLIPAVNAQYPTVAATARQYVSDAKASAVAGYQNWTVSGADTRHGNVHGIVVTNAAGHAIAGVNVKVTLSGPAVFTSTGTKTWTGKSTTSALSLDWESTGNGEVTGVISYQGGRKTLTKYAADGTVQDTLSYGNAGVGDPEWTDVKGTAFRVIYDFQPIATSNVGESKILDSGKLSDTITTAADKSYGDGKWLQIDGKSVPVVFEGTAYYTGETPAAESATVPEGAKVVGSTTITAEGPGEYTASIEGDYDPSFVTWVWKVVKDTQPGTIGTAGIAIKDLVHADWADHFGLADETSSIRHEAEVDSTLTIRNTKSGTYLVDDLWITGLPTNHPDFTGAAGFKADEKEFTQKLLFFPEALDVTDANATQAEEIATVTVPAKNGFYPSVGSTDFKMKDGEVGTYVFVTEFKGDDRVKPFASSVEDTTEQYTVTPGQPELKTTATDGSDGDKVLPNTGTVTINDEVCYTNLTVGKEYTLTGTLMDKATGKPLQADGKDVTGTTTVTPTKKDDCTTVTFTTEAKNLAGKTTVVFERLTQDGRTIAVHTDINDEGQTVTTPDTPALATTATDAADGDKTVTPAKQVTINDKVCYTNLTVGKEYTLTGTLMDKATEKPYQADGKDVTGTTTFTPTKKDDCTTVTFTFDGSTLAGKSLVVFEEASHDGTVVAVHTDINDEGQTVTFTGGDNDKGGAGKSKGLALTGSDAATIGGAAALMAAAGATTLAVKRRRA